MVEILKAGINFLKSVLSLFCEYLCVCGCRHVEVRWQLSWVSSLLHCVILRDWIQAIRVSFRHLSTEPISPTIWFYRLKNLGTPLYLCAENLVDKLEGGVCYQEGHRIFEVYGESRLQLPHQCHAFRSSHAGSEIWQTVSSSGQLGRNSCSPGRHIGITSGRNCSDGALAFALLMF